MLLEVRMAGHQTHYYSVISSHASADSPLKFDAMASGKNYFPRFGYRTVKKENEWKKTTNQSSHEESYMAS